MSAEAVFEETHNLSADEYRHLFELFLTAAQFQNVKEIDYSRVLFDDELSRELGLQPTNAEPAVGCEIKRRDRKWWQTLIGRQDSMKIISLAFPEP